MKKVLCVLLIAVLVFGVMMTSALAMNFTLYFTETESDAIWPESEWKYTSTDRINLRYSVYGGDNFTSNLFRALRDESGRYIICGQRWCVPGVYSPIQSNAIYSDYYYTIGARCNTSYFELTGVPFVIFTGTFDVN